MELNPYAKYLGERDPMDVLSRTASKIAMLVGRLPPRELKLTTPGEKWSAREIVAHLADCEIVFGFRLKQTLAENSPTVQPFDQDRWSKRYGNHDMENALRLFGALREWNQRLIEETTPEERQREMTHPERGTMTFWTVVETMAGHDINHLLQLERLASPVAIR